jgi:hypothetical protein
MGSSQSQQRQGTGISGMFGGPSPQPSSGVFGQSAPQGYGQPASSSWFGGKKRKSKGKKKTNHKTKRRR